MNEEVNRQVCWCLSSSFSISPSLPYGLHFINGTLIGQALEESPLQEYQVIQRDAVSSFWLEISSSFNAISVGFESRVIYIGVPILPITIFTDGAISKLSIMPPLVRGMELDVENRMIYGKYNGTAAMIVYTITASNGFRESRVQLRLIFRAVDQEMKGIVGCTFPFPSMVHKPIEWYEHSTPLSCDMYDSFIHLRHGMEHKAVRFVGYLSINDSGEYFFLVNSTDGVRMRIDGQLLLMSPIGESTMTIRSLFLSSGKHLVEIIHISMNETSVFELYYRRNAFSDDWLVVNSTILLAGGISPFNYHINDLVTYVDPENPISTSPPTVNGFPCGYHTISSSLPTGLSINTTSGVIKGTPSKVGYFTYTVTCSGVFGSVSTPFIISLTSVPQNGLQVTYFYDEDTFALSVIENAIDHPLVDAGVPWPSLPLRLFRGFIAKWDGLFYVSTRGEYTFRFTLSGGVRVYLNGGLVLSKWENHEPNKIFEFTYTFYKSRYCPFRVEYIHYGFESGIQFFIRLPYSTQYTIPSLGILYNNMQEVFRYTTKQMLCVVNTTVISNGPLFSNHVASSFFFSSVPELPEGFDLNNGVITGVPLEVISSQEFTIVAKSTTLTLTTVVLIAVQDIEIPGNIVVYDLLGHHYSRFSVYQYSLVTPLILDCSVSNVIWSITPSLPEGFTLDNRQSRIAGRALSIYPNTTFLIHAQTNGGERSVFFPIEVKGCEHGKFLYTSFSNSSAGMFYLRRNNTTVVEEQIVDGDYGIVLCVPKKEYIIRIICYNRETCLFHLYREDGLCMLMRSLTTGVWNEIKFNFNDKQPPIIATKTPTIITRVNTPFHCHFTVIHPYQVLQFLPSLPSSFSFDQKTLKLTGFYRHSAVLEFTVVAQNDYGSYELPFKIYVDQCPGESQLYRFSRLNSELTESFLISTKNEVVYSNQFTGEPFGEFICLSPQEYSIVLSDDEGIGWVPGSDLIVQDSLNRVITTFLLDSGKSFVTEVLSLTKLLPEESDFRYLIPTMAPPLNWLEIDFDDTQWPVTSSPSWPTIPSSLATIYYRRVVSVKEGSLAIHLFFQEGCIVYIDGLEVDRFNMPSGAVYHSTTAVSTYNSTRWITVFSSFYSVPRDVILAVEVHRFYVVIPSQVTFDVMISRNLSPQLLLPVEGTPHEAFDGSRRTSWWFVYPESADITFSEAQFFPLNRIDIAVGPLFLWEAPGSFTLYGYTDEFTKLFEFSSNTMFKAPYGVFSATFPTVSNYSSFLLRFSSSMGSTFIDIRAIAFYSSIPILCKEEKAWPEVAEGVTVEGQCLPYSVGKSQRVCGRVGLNGIWGNITYTYCLERNPKLGSLFFDTSIVFTNVTRATWKNSLESKVERVILGNLNDSKVTLLPFGDCSTKSTLRFEVGVRVETKKSMKSLVYQHLTELQTSINVELKKIGVDRVVAQMDKNITIRDSSVMFTICCVILALLFIVIVVAYSIRKRIRSIRIRLV